MPSLLLGQPPAAMLELDTVSERRRRGVFLSALGTASERAGAWKLGHLFLKHPVRDGRTSGRSVGDCTLTRGHAFRARTRNIAGHACTCKRGTHTRPAMHLSCSPTTSGSHCSPTLWTLDAGRRAPVRRKSFDDRESMHRSTPP